MTSALSFVFLGMSITSSWGNAHATTYRSLLRALTQRGHRVAFLERELPCYAANGDMPSPECADVALYGSLEELGDRHGDLVREADVVVVGSHVPEGAHVGDWVLGTANGLAAFYDIDTPVTLRMLESGGAEYILPRQVASYDLYLSFTGGPTLRTLERRFGSPRARALYCSADPELHYPESHEARWDLGYLGTFSEDRQPALQQLLLRPAQRWQNGRFVVAGAQYPATTRWPTNIDRKAHLPPPAHREFYGAQRFTLNVTRGEMIAAGHSPGARLFEAAACGTPIISDVWAGLDGFFEPEREILLAHSENDVLRMLHSVTDGIRETIGERARRRVLAQHTAAHRAESLESYVYERTSRRRRSVSVQRARSHAQ